MSATPSDFFKTARTASEIKAELLPRLIEVWATGMLQQGRAGELALSFMDLQAGLDSGEPAPTAVQLLRQVYKSTGSRTDLNKGISTLFYDADQSILDRMQQQIKQLPFYRDLIHLPVFLAETDDETLATQLQENVQPDLAFLNPNAAGIAQQLLLSGAQKGKTDLMMLFDPRLLESAVRKAKVDSVWQQFFGERLEAIKAFYKQHKHAERREEYLLDCFEEVFRAEGFQTLRFRVNPPDKKQAGHYLVFSVKSAQVYIRLKELLERYGDYQEDGVPLFGANLQQQQTALFHEHYTYSIANLVQELTQVAAEFSNRTVQYVYERHSMGTHYTLSNYQTAYDKLMRQNVVRFINPKTGQPISKLTPVSLIRYKK